jgi:hypothetical protein
MLCHRGGVYDGSSFTASAVLLLWGKVWCVFVGRDYRGHITYRIQYFSNTIPRWDLEVSCWVCLL